MIAIVLVISILMCILFSNSIFAQQKAEIRIAYGGTFLHNSVLSFADGHYGALSLSLDAKINKRVGIGLQLNNMLGKYKNRVLDCSVGPCETLREFEETKIQGLLFFKLSYYWLVKSNLELYSSALLSPPVEVPYATLPVPHITLLGFRKGNQHAVFGELGIGFSQIVSVGYAYNFLSEKT